MRASGAERVDEPAAEQPCRSEHEERARRRACQQRRQRSGAYDPWRFEPRDPGGAGLRIPSLPLEHGLERARRGAVAGDDERETPLFVGLSRIVQQRRHEGAGFAGDHELHPAHDQPFEPRITLSRGVAETNPCSDGPIEPSVAAQHDHGRPGLGPRQNLLGEPWAVAHEAFLHDEGGCADARQLRAGRHGLQAGERLHACDTPAAAGEHADQ